VPRGPRRFVGRLQGVSSRGAFEPRLASRASRATRPWTRRHIDAIRARSNERTDSRRTTVARAGIRGRGGARRAARRRAGRERERERERGWTTNQRRGTRASCAAPRRVRASIARDVDGDHRARGEREREAAEAAEVSCGGVFLSHEPSFRGSCPTDRIPIRIRRSGTRRRRRRRRARATRWMKMRPLTSTSDSCARERWCETRESDETDDSTPRA